MDRSDEGGDPACWAHLFEEEPEAVADGQDEVEDADENGAASPTNGKQESRTAT